MPDATAMAVRDGVVAWLGSDDVGRAQFPDAEVVDLDGGFVAPAFVDSHVHVTATGLTLAGLDLRAATSRAALPAADRRLRRTHPDGPIWGARLGRVGLAGSRAAQPPTTSTRVVGDRPAYLARVDVHSAAASTALRRLTPDLTAAHGFDAQRPLTADAHHLVRAAARDLLTPEQRARARVAALDAAAADGIVAVHECAGPDIGGLDDWHELRGTAARRRGRRLLGRGGHHRRRRPRRLLDDDRRPRAGRRPVRRRRARVAHRLAAASRTPTRRTTAATRYLDPDAIAAHLRACTEAGITAGFHVIGDAAVTAVVDALQRVVEQLGAPAVARCGHRLEHLEMVTAEQAAELGAWGVIASVQPNFDALWGGDDGMYAQRLGADRGVRLNPLALLASQGVPLAFGSDTPVTSMNPWATRARGGPPPAHPAARCRCARRSRRPPAAPGAPAGSATASPARWCPARPRPTRCGTPDELEVSAPDDAVQRWSTDPRSRVPALPRLGPTTGCRDACRPCTGVSSSMAKSQREWGRADDDTGSSPADDEPDRRRARPVGQSPREAAQVPDWVKRFGDALVARLPRISVAVVGRFCCCVSFPPFGWWCAASSRSRCWPGC